MKSRFDRWLRPQKEKKETMTKQLNAEYADRLAHRYVELLALLDDCMVAYAEGRAYNFNEWVHDSEDSRSPGEQWEKQPTNWIDAAIGYHQESSKLAALMSARCGRWQAAVQKVIQVTIDDQQPEGSTDQPIVGQLQRASQNGVKFEVMK